METTAGTLLDGRVVYAQPLVGYRTGIEPVLLAACVRARAGQTVMEAGTGAGAGLLCLAARVPDAIGIGIEQDGALAALAQSNAAANGFAGLTIINVDLLALPAGPLVDHAMANPPWHLHDSTATPNSQRDMAKRGRPGLIASWAVALGKRVRHRGTLTLVVPARAMAESLAGLDKAGCGSVTVMPLWPSTGREARIVLVQGVRGGRGGARVLPGLTLHETPSSYTAAALAVLRGGSALPF
jgi:tRNA1(Val) A37 N6-methylase TrmN6